MRRALLLFTALATSSVNFAFAETWVIDPDSRSLTFSFDSPAGFVDAEIQNFEADITFDPNDLGNASVLATIFTRSFIASEAEVSIRVQKPDFFDTVSHGKAYFVGENFRALGGNRYSADGFLQIRDQVSPFGFEFELDIEGDQAAFSAEFPLNRLTAGLGNEKFPDNRELTVDIPIKLSFTAQASN